MRKTGPPVETKTRVRTLSDFHTSAMAALIRSHVFGLFLAALVFGVAVPCEVLEAAGVLVCMEEASDCSAEQNAGDDEEACCAVCLACCAVGLEPGIDPHTRPETSILAGVRGREGLLSEPPIPVWHPPRA